MLQTNTVTIIKKAENLHINANDVLQNLSMEYWVSTPLNASV